MASQKKAGPVDRPPAEQVARENYKLQFGTTKPDATLPSAVLETTDPQDVPVTPASENTDKE